MTAEDAPAHLEHGPLLDSLERFQMLYMPGAYNPVGMLCEDGHGPVVLLLASGDDVSVLPAAPCGTRLSSNLADMLHQALEHVEDEHHP